MSANEVVFSSWPDLMEQLFVFFDPPCIDHRIINQYALFSTISNSTALVDTWLIKHPNLFRKTIIPEELKWAIRDKLHKANVTERI